MFDRLLLNLAWISDSGTGAVGTISSGMTSSATDDLLFSKSFLCGSWGNLVTSSFPS